MLSSIPYSFTICLITETVRDIISVVVLTLKRYFGVVKHLFMVIRHLRLAKNSKIIEKIIELNIC